jgi:ZIP family zinc transporter
MNEFLKVSAFAALPAFGNFGGGLLAEILPISKRTLSISLHAATGALIAVVGIELMPRALTTSLPWLSVAAFIAGGGVFILLDRVLRMVRLRFESSGGSFGAWMIFFAVSVDLFTDGIMIGTGSTVSKSLGLLLALGQVSADIPEGFATIVKFKADGIGRARRLMLAGAFAVPVFTGASVGYWVMRNHPELYKLLVLALTGGILLATSLGEMLAEAHETRDTPLMTIALVAGFGFFSLITVYLA